MNINTITISGRLTADPVARHTPGGKSVCTFSVATRRKFSTETTDFFNVETWNMLADACENQLKKGNRVIVVGKMENHKYTKDDVTRDKWIIVASDVEFIDRQVKATSPDEHDPFADDSE